MRHLSLGASLYVPATRPDLVAIGNGERYPELRSVIFCTEDAIRADEVDTALRNLAEACPQLAPGRMLRFIRPRNHHVLGRLLATPGISHIDGFVLPKATVPSFKAALAELTPRDPFLLMPTLETVEVFNQRAMYQFLDVLSDDQVRPRILSLRIGGNDLLHLLGVRRSPRRTIYETALGTVISTLSTIFTPHGFNLTAPVFEGLNHPDVLREEVELDLQHGLFGKTAVHPTQIGAIEALYQVAPEDLDMAERMLAEDAPAVFRMHDTMCEGATHSRWAQLVRARATLYGVATPEADRATGPGVAGPVPAARSARPRRALVSAAG